MRAEDVPAELVEKAAAAIAEWDIHPLDVGDIVRDALAAVLPDVYEEMQQGTDESYGMGYRDGYENQSQTRAEIQAQAWDKALDVCCEMNRHKNLDWPNPYREDTPDAAK